jgi:hypothetical protein
VSTADQRERSQRDDERSQHESSCPGTATASTGTGDLILANDRDVLAGRLSTVELTSGEGSATQAPCP